MNGAEKNHLTTFHGHRFNISFQNAAAVYYHLDDIAEFLEIHPSTNDLFKSLRFDIKEPVYKAGVRAMGIMYRLVTQPLQIRTNQEGSILDLNADLHQLQMQLTKWSDDASTSLADTPILDVHLPEDDVSKSIFLETDAQCDSLTMIAMQMMSTNMLIVLERQAASQLPGGIYWDPSPEVKKMAENVPRSNVVSERDMAILDNLLREKPCLGTTNAETMVMWLNNKPSAWLRNQTPTEQALILADAEKRASEFKAIFKVRQGALKEQMVKKLREQRNQKESKEQKQIKSSIALTRDVQESGGLWSLTELDDKVNDTPQGKLKSTVLKQIKFHKSVIGAKGPRTLFQEQVKNEKYKPEQLVENLRQILHLNGDEKEMQEATKLKYRPDEDVRVAMASKKQELLKAIQTGRTSNQVKQQKLGKDEYLLHPEKLVDKRVKHKCKEVRDGVKVVDWFDGHVLSVESMGDSAEGTLYNITYDEDPKGNNWVFPLLQDIKKGDLIVL